MVVVGSWNVRGGNSPKKHLAVHSWINQNKIEIFGLLEARISVNNLAAVLPRILSTGWEGLTNIADHPNGRIVVGWNAQKLRLKRLDSTA